ADDLRPALAVDVARLTDLLQELAAEPCLLRDLAQGAGLIRLALVALALREAPVVVLRPVHEQHRAVSHDESTRGPNDGQIVLRSFPPAFGHAALPSSRRSSSRSTRRPATSACSGAAPAASSRNRSAATTASWCSPRTSCSFFARFTSFFRPASSAAYLARLPFFRTACRSSFAASSGSLRTALRSLAEARSATSSRLTPDRLGSSSSIAREVSSSRARYSSERSAASRRLRLQERSVRSAARSDSARLPSLPPSSAASASRRASRTSRSRTSPRNAP